MSAVMETGGGNLIWNRSTSVTATPENKKADTEEHPTRAVFHVGLLINEPPGIAETPFA